MAQEYRILFICVSRHIGLALAKSAISSQRKVAIAFGCESATDIRLHYFAAADYSRNKRSGGIEKVDNSNGSKVEIMNCNVNSYLVAMFYMLSFNDKPQIITYWDEPTITMDVPSHPLHEQIHKNWVEHKISTVVLSCATLPHEHEIQPTIASFRDKFPGAEIHTIDSFHLKKSVSLVNSSGEKVLPHLLFPDPAELQQCVAECKTNPTLLRYFDLSSIVQYIESLLARGQLEEMLWPENYFDLDVDGMNMTSIKQYYLAALKNEKSKGEPRFPLGPPPPQKLQGNELIRLNTAPVTSSMASPNDFRRLNTLPFTGTGAARGESKAHFGSSLFTTAAAYTLTNGPAIYLTENVENLAKFYIHSTKIPPVVLTQLMAKITANGGLQEKLSRAQKMLEDKLAAATATSGDFEKNEGSGGSSGGGLRKMERREQRDPEITKLVGQVDALRAQFQPVRMDNKYIPNTAAHQTIWVSSDTKQHIANAFVPDISDEVVKEIMET